MAQWRLAAALDGVKVRRHRAPPPTRARQSRLFSGPDEGDDGHGYHLMLRRGLSMHRDDCALVGQPDQRFWKGPFSREEAIRQADPVPATFIPRVGKGDCTAEETEWLLALGWDKGWSDA